MSSRTTSGTEEEEEIAPLVTVLMTSAQTKADLQRNLIATMSLVLEGEGLHWGRIIVLVTFLRELSSKCKSKLKEPVETLEIGEIAAEHLAAKMDGGKRRMGRNGLLPEEDGAGQETPSRYGSHNILVSYDLKMVVKPLYSPPAHLMKRAEVSTLYLCLFSLYNLFVIILEVF